MRLSFASPKFGSILDFLFVQRAEAITGEIEHSECDIELFLYISWISENVLNLGQVTLVN